MGLRDCTLAMCSPGESPFARRSAANVRQNLIGLRRLMEGCGADGSGLGFDDLLDSMGAPTVATALRDRIAAAQLAAAAIEESAIEDAVAADQPSVRALYDQIKAITDLLKTDFVTLLDVQIPTEVTGDVD